MGAIDPNSIKAPAGWVESLLRSKAQIAAGDVFPLEPILREMQAEIEQMEAGIAAKKARRRAG